MARGDDETDRQWHLDKKVPVALIVAILMSAAGNVWWLSGLSSRVDYLERQVPIRDDVIAMKAQLDGIQRAIVRFEAMFDRREVFREGKETRP